MPGLAIFKSGERVDREVGEQGNAHGTEVRGQRSEVRGQWLVGLHRFDEKRFGVVDHGTKVITEVKPEIRSSRFHMADFGGPAA